MLEIKKLELKDMQRLWEVAFKEDDYPWNRTNAPYFEDHQAITYEVFESTYLSLYCDVDFRQGIFLNEELIGLVSFYWESKETRWLEFGIVIYDETQWNKGIGSTASSFWIDRLFDEFPEIQHLGFTTWSGNPGMMSIGQNLGMMQEARIRKVRYYNDVYYDSVKYGILRSEWENRKLMF